MVDDGGYWTILQSPPSTITDRGHKDDGYYV